MKLTHLSNMRIVIARLVAVSGTANRLALSTVTAALGNLQPLNQFKTQAIAGVPGKTFVIYLDAGIDIQENDQLKDEQGNIYTVKKGGVTRYQQAAMDYQAVYLTRT